MGRLVMRTITVLAATIACLGVPAAFAETPQSEVEGPTQTQMEHMVYAMKTCRAETNAFIAATEQDAKQRKDGPAQYHVDGPKGVSIAVDKSTFSDFYLASCYQRMLAEDPIMQNQTFVSDGAPIS